MALKPVFLFSMKYVSAGESFGDSYTFGIAGTGGTSSSASATVVEWLWLLLLWLLPLLLCAEVLLSDGNLDEDVRGGARGWIDPVDVVRVLKLLVDPIDSPELYDFLLLMSGVVRAEDGVRDGFRGIIEGDLESSLVLIDTGGGGGGTLAIMFMLCD